MTASGRGALVGALAAVWLALAVPAGLSITAVLAGLTAAALGAAVAAGWPAVHEAARRTLRYAEDLVAPGEEREPPPVREDAPELAERVVHEVLSTLAAELDAERLTVWSVDRGSDTVEPEYALGTGPRPQRAAGNPVAWAVDERHTMTLDPTPSWGRGAVLVTPVDGHRGLTLETARGRALEPDRVAAAGRIVGALLRLVDRDADARAERDRLHRVTEFLSGLSRDHDPEGVPDSLADAALDLLDARGALVASWDGTAGMVLTRVGEADGPAPGDAFAMNDGDLAHAGRAGATVLRGPGEAGRRPALARDAEDWTRIPPYRVVVPLIEPDGQSSGLVAAWGDRAPPDEGVGLLEGLGPLLSLHLRHATDLVRFRRRATADALTGLANRAAFDERLAEEQTRFHRYRRPTALMIIDLDHFKRINDTHGHEAGDAVLRAVADTVERTVRDVDVPARYGGEEFVVLMPETMLRAAEDVAERVRHAIANTEVEHDGLVISVTASIGVSGCPESVDEPAALFERADRALYAAKEAGRDRVMVARRTAAG